MAHYERWAPGEGPRRHEFQELRYVYGQAVGRYFNLLLILCTNIVTGNHNSFWYSRSRPFFLEFLELGSARIVIISTCSLVFLSVWWLRHVSYLSVSAFLSVFSSDWFTKPKFEISHQCLQFFLPKVWRINVVWVPFGRSMLCMWLISESVWIARLLSWWFLVVCVQGGKVGNGNHLVIRFYLSLFARDVGFTKEHVYHVCSLCLDILGNVIKSTSRIVLCQHTVNLHVHPPCEKTQCVWPFVWKASTIKFIGQAARKS